MIKGIFIDLDETLLNDSQHILPYDKLVIQQVLALGHKVYLITGKSLRTAIGWYRELGLKTFLVTSLGQVISNPSDAHFKTRVISTSGQLLRQALKALQARLEVVNFLFETYSGAIFVQHINDSNLVKMLATDIKPRTFGPNVKLSRVVGSYVETVMLPETVLAQVVAELNGLFANALDFTYWQFAGQLPIINFKPVNIGKAAAMQQVMILDNLKYTISFGNGWSDRNMLANANEGYAMVNAGPAVKAFTKLLADDDNNHSGVGKTLARIFELS